ncbi:unnamed protein product [Paramecium sonneborni]|uniref:Uncharacterized protein n=1 Tax=Paramecium sonneborni TaxID=65129 RepID=A0A8S1Q5W2_9CILI|nr:unnamed protein product [Paramecium sonneborni]
MLTSFEDLYFEENTTSKYCYFETDNFLPIKDYNESIEQFGMLIEAQIDDVIINQNDTPENEPQSTFQENIHLQNNFCLPIKKKMYRFPRESKNYFKNIGPKLRKFIMQNFSQTHELINHPLIVEFLKVKNQSHTKLHIKQLCKSSQGLAIAKTFFKNFRWAKSLVNDDLRSYFRLNSEWNN